MRPSKPPNPKPHPHPLRPDAKQIYKNLIPTEIRKKFPQKNPQSSINFARLTRRFPIFILMQPHRIIPFPPQPLSNLDGQSLPETFLPEVLVIRDDYPFGMEMPGQVYVASEYRYGFNGMERDDDVKGTGDSYDFGARMYDPRVGRWWSRDPMEKSYVEFSSYSFALNSPNFHIDLDGAFVRDANGYIVFTATSGTRPTLHLNQLFFDASWNVFYGYEYESITGYILDNSGLRIQVRLPTSNVVRQVIYAPSQMQSIGYDASGAPQVGTPRVGETPIDSRVAPGLDGSANCTGVSCLDGKFVLSSGYHSAPIKQHPSVHQGHFYLALLRYQSPI